LNEKFENVILTLSKTLETNAELQDDGNYIFKED
jgi:hypothetical protein